MYGRQPDKTTISIKKLSVQPYPGMTIGCMNGGAPPTAACAAADCDAAC